jgi:ABC-type transport system substrate-binding protein
LGRLSPFKQGLIGGLVIITLGALISGAGAVVAQDWFNPVDVVEETTQPQQAVPRAAEALDAANAPGNYLKVFQTSLTYNGAGPAGYGRSAMHAACRLEDPASHFCSIQEIETAYKTGGLNIVATGQAWIDNIIAATNDSGYAGDVSAVSDWYGGNDNSDYPYNCNAWTNSTNTGRGMILNSGAISPATEACDDIHPIACCR